jgi:proteic killer suppression protein
MIGSFRNKALRRFWEDGDRRGLRPDMVGRVSDFLLILHNAETPADVNVVGSGFHGLRGKPKRYAVSVNRNWRITFGWDDDAAVDVDLEDYH